MAMMGLAGVLGYHAMAAISAAQELSSLPMWVAAALGGASFGLLATLGSLPRHLVIARDPVTEVYRSVRASSDGEILSLVDRAYGLWSETAARLPASDEHRATLRDGVQRLFDVAARWNETRADGDESAAATALQARLGELEAKVAATSDAQAQLEYQRARNGVADQLRTLGEIRTRRERVLARLHTYLTAMERLRLALLNRDTAGASLQAALPAVAEVEALGRDVDQSSDALDLVASDLDAAVPA
jgi:hypothetical protein